MWRDWQYLNYLLANVVIPPQFLQKQPKWFFTDGVFLSWGIISPSPALWCPHPCLTALLAPTPLCFPLCPMPYELHVSFALLNFYFPLPFKSWLHWIPGANKSSGGDRQMFSLGARAPCRTQRRKLTCGASKLALAFPKRAKFTGHISPFQGSRK